MGIGRSTSSPASTPQRRSRSSGRQTWHTAPTNAVAFFKQMGEALRLNPLPDASTGLNGIPLRTLPSWVVPQSRAKLALPQPVLSRKSPRWPCSSPSASPRTASRSRATGAPNRSTPSRPATRPGTPASTPRPPRLAIGPATNYWSYLNSGIGKYPNTPQGYLYRAALIVYGGANMPQDAVYAQINNLDGTSATQLDGNNTYKLTFTPPVTNPATLPVIGTLPPTMNDPQGNPRGFWSITLYQTDATESAAPFITQASVLNTAYSTANIAVTAVDPSTNTITVEPSAWGPLIASTPDPLRSDRGAVWPHAGRPVLRRDHPDAQDRPEDQEHDVLVPGVDAVAAGPVQGHIPDSRCRSSSAAGPVRSPPDQPGRSGQPAVGPNPAGLAAGIAAADLRQARTEPRWVGDDLDRTDVARQRHPRPTGSPHHPRRTTRASTRRLGVDTHADKLMHVAFTTQHQEQHAGVDPAPAERVDGGHVRVPAPPAVS